MADIAWTAEQRAAIEAVGRSVTVSAAAGSGKTAVLAERCAYLVCDAPPPYRCRIDQLLVVTFTKAAAEEMKTRIRANLIDRRDANPSDDYLRQQVSLIDTAQISTIDSFCTWVLRRWFDEAGIDPAFTVLPPDEARILYADAMQAIVDARYDSDDAGGRAFRELVDAYGLGEDAGIKDFVHDLASHLDSLPDPESWLGEAHRRLVEQPDLVCEELCVALHREMEHQRDHARRFQSLADSRDRRVAFYGDLLMTHAAQLDAWCQAALTFDRLREQIVDYNPTARGVPKRKKDCTDVEESEQDAVKAEFAAAMDRFKKRIRKRFARFSVDEIGDGLRATAPYVSTLFNLARDLRTAYTERKRRLDVLDFSDLERHAFDVLHRDDVAEAVRQRFAHVLVDEYQDINRLQAALLDRACRADDNNVLANLFTVGDVKQSIYRFRLAEPKVFLERLGENPQANGTILLRKNFRSRPHILDGVNLLFSQLMRTEVGGIAYGDNEALYPGRDADDANVPRTIEVHLLEQKVQPIVADDDPETPAMVDANDPAEWESIEREAYLIATRIRDILDSDMTIDGSRKPTPKDMAILLRAHKYRAERIAGVLHRFGIAAHAYVRGTMFDTTEIRDIRALLDILDNAQQDIPLASVLRSHIIGLPLSEDDLLAIRMLDRAAPFHEVVRRYVVEGENERLKSVLSKILGRIQRYRHAMRDRPFADVLWQILDQTGYLAYVGGLTGGTQRRANLRSFHERAREFGTFKTQGLRRFLQYIESLEQGDQDIGAAPAVAEGADAVRIMSIHAAKGLEFPIVFLADLGRRFNLGDTRGRMILDRDAGVGLRVVDEERMIEYPTAAHHLAADNIERSTRAEELRILYVAMTRARDMLFLVGGTSLSRLESRQFVAPTTGDSITALTIESATAPLDWIIPALSSIEDEGEPLFKITTHDSDSMKSWQIPSQSTHEISPIHQAVARLHALPPEETTTSPAPAEVDPVLQRIRFDYSHLSASSVRAVMAASEVKRRYDITNDANEPVGWVIEPPSAPADRAAAQLLGTATHKAMEHLDFATAVDADAVGLQLQRLAESGLLTLEEASEVDTGAIAWFANTPLGLAVRDAGDDYRREFMFIAAHPVQWFDDTLDPDVEERVLVRGIVDGVLPRDGGIEVLDFKTDRVTGDGVAKRAKRYHQQMRLYAASVAPLFEKSVTHCRLVFLHPREIVTLDHIT